MEFSNFDIFNESRTFDVRQVKSPIKRLGILQLRAINFPSRLHQHSVNFFLLNQEFDCVQYFISVKFGAKGESIYFTLSGNYWKLQSRSNYGNSLSFIYRPEQILIEFYPKGRVLQIVVVESINIIFTWRILM